MAWKSMLALSALAIGTAALAGEPHFERFTYSGQSQERVAVGPGEYRNPILSGYYPDPLVVRVGEDYYLANSSFISFPGIPVWHSRDLVHWRQIGNAIDRPTQLSFLDRTTATGVFAPDISYHDGLFYIVNTCVDCGGNFVITAKDPAGPWSDPIWLPFDGIDPSIYWEGDRAYIVNNRMPAQPARYNGHRAIWVQEFDWRTGTMRGESTELVDGGTDLAKKPIWVEGPHLFRRGDYYYLMAAEGGTEVNHSEVIFRAKSLRGPFTPWAGNPILTQRDLDPARPDPVTSTGHAKLVQTQNGEWWATFLGVRPYAGNSFNIGRETFLLPVTWQDDWPVILPHGKRVPFAVAAPRLPAGHAPDAPTTGDFSYQEDFDGSTLGPAWTGIRIPRQPFWRLAGGDLILGRGAKLGVQLGTPSFIGRRQQHHVVTVSTTLRFTPEHEEDRAGLAAYQSDRNYAFVGIAREAGTPVVALYISQGGTERLVASRPHHGPAPLTLTMRQNGGTLSFAYSENGQETVLASGIDARFLSTEAAGGFVGTIIGPYAFYD
ncbi:glycoside hydrolase 43 family protein [Sphingomonas metalli]|uniref:Glycoside hydrolase 43 family protein n=1 Tax=Sphingomonas metalli TaxID=1779358 RepID=A0A916TD64_9SPHN|nr:glycoside hydrolase family 43 protein [Sphingomonas metalli]GGB40964.1 glycoside hydrolase 43 family protein [Sphingomonas metalli]